MNTFTNWLANYAPLNNIVRIHGHYPESYHPDRYLLLVGFFL